MSSLRNAIKRITHKERSQPTNRQHLGILEKKSDYKVRAKDYHHKQNVLTNLRTKASMRNPDEFYFGMNNAQVDGATGKHRKLEQAKAKEEERIIGPEVVKLMKTQDLSYVRMLSTLDRNKVERLQSSLHFLDSQQSNDTDIETREFKKRKHTIFTDDEEKANNFDLVEHFDTVPELAGRTFNRPKRSSLLASLNDNNEDVVTGEQTQSNAQKQAFLLKKNAVSVAKARKASYKEMEARLKRIELLKRTEAHLITEKIVASKGRKRKVKESEDGQPAIYKFRRKRSK